MKWISVKERNPLPDEEIGYVFAPKRIDESHNGYKGNGLFDDIWYNNKRQKWRTYTYTCGEIDHEIDCPHVTHWMALPEPPKE